MSIRAGMGLQFPAFCRSAATAWFYNLMIMPAAATPANRG